jgi:hypothetical protein
MRFAFFVNAICQRSMLWCVRRSWRVPDGERPATGVVLPFAGVPEPAIDSPWTLEVKHYTIVKVRAEIPLLTEPDEH